MDPSSLTYFEFFAGGHLFGDGLAVPVVAWLSEHLLLPLAGRGAAGSLEERAA